MDGNSVAILAPARSLRPFTFDSSGTATTSLAFPTWRSRSSRTSTPRSRTRSRPVIPRSATPEATYSGMSAGRAKRISTRGSLVGAMSCLPSPSGWRPLFPRISRTGPAIRPLFGTASRTRSEGLELTGNYLLRDAGDVLQGGVEDGLDLPGDGLEARPVLRDDLGTRDEGLVDGVPDLGEDADVDLLDPLH